jgi:hypothetical protein
MNHWIYMLWILLVVRHSDVKHEISPIFNLRLENTICLLRAEIRNSTRFHLHETEDYSSYKIASCPNITRCLHLIRANNRKISSLSQIKIWPYYTFEIWSQNSWWETSIHLSLDPIWISSRFMPIIHSGHNKNLTTKHKESCYSDLRFECWLSTSLGEFWWQRKHL